MGDNDDPSDVDEWGSIDTVALKQAAARKIDKLVVHLEKLQRYYHEAIASDDPTRLSEELAEAEPLLRSLLEEADESRALVDKKHLHRQLCMISRRADLAGRFVDIHEYLEPGSPEYYYNILEWELSCFAGKFLSMFSKWRRTRDIDVVDECRESFIECMVKIEDLYDRSGFRERAEDSRSIKDAALEAHRKRLGFDVDDLPPLPPIPAPPRLDGYDDEQVSVDAGPGKEESLDERSRRLWEEYLIRKGGSEQAFTRIEDIPEGAKDLFFLNHYIHVFHAMENIFTGELEKAADLVEKVGDYELDATGDCFVASLLDAIALLDKGILPRADAFWARVKEKLFSNPSQIDLEMICGDTYRRSVGVLASNKVKKGTMIIRRYNLSDPASRESGERDIALSRFAEKALGEEHIVPRELACFENGGWLYHVETRIPGISFEQQIADGGVYPALVQRSLRAWRKYQVSLSIFSEEDPEMAALLERPDYDLEFCSKFLDRLDMFPAHGGLSFDYAAAREAMGYVLDFLEIAPEGVVHNDARGANIIISPGGLVSIIDLEKTGLGKFMFDIVGFVEHTKVEGGIDLGYDPYYVFTHDKDGWLEKEGSPNYYRMVVPASCVFKMSHLCGSVIKYHLEPADWDAVGRSRVLGYLEGIARYAGVLRGFASGTLRSAASELEGFFKDLESQVKKMKI